VKEITGKVALVTGGTHGVGRAIAVALAEAGADVAINHPASDAAAADLVAQLTAENNIRCQGYPAEIADEAAVRTMIEAIESDFGHIDILVNNAGTTRDKSFLNLTRAMWDEMLGVNLNGPFNVTNAVLRTMVNRGWGRIVNICAMGGQSGNFGQANNTVTKGGLIAFTMTLARELARKGITVNAVAPGYTVGDLASGVPENVNEQIRQMIPMGRAGEPGEIAAVVAFLAGPRASYITGQVIGVNGGMYM
jgi:NAD(P)-dependent dehydrogenase (short-subunit alcohol dehydrogenase family)